MHAEYDFGGGARGKYAERFANGTESCSIPDVATICKTRDEVSQLFVKSHSAAVTPGRPASRGPTGHQRRRAGRQVKRPLNVPWFSPG